jgi:sugar phosphate isomerase/epimerase
MKVRIGLQLYSIRQAMEQDFWGSLAKVKAAGYDCVEFAGYGGYSAGELRRELDRIGLEAYSSHVAFGQLDQDLEDVLAFSVELGLSWVICPGYPIKSADDCRKISQILARTAKALQPCGIQVGYHNHHREFIRFNGRYALDLITENADNLPIAVELDTCWAQYADVDPVAYYQSLGAKAGPIHCKDINAGYQGMDGKDINAEVGGGIIDFAGLIAAARRQGTLANGLIVEQEAFARDPFESIRISCDNLRRLLA